MDYIRQYKSFINSHYFNGAIRITVGITLPAILLSHFHNLIAGLSLSIGAMCVGNTDNPGPIHHRRNGMIACVLIIFLVTLLMGLASGSQWLSGLLVFVFCFMFSFMGVYGTRATSIGVNALLVMVLNIDRHRSGLESLITAAYVFAGGVWYTVLSLLLYSFRPYKLVQQAIGDCLQATAGYLRIKAAFYSRDVDYDQDYRQLVESQVSIHEKQQLVRELLFKSRSIVKESTHVGRVLMMIFLDIIDLFERIMTSQQDYRMLHEFFDESGLMQECRGLILDLAAELDEIGIAIMSGKASVENKELPSRIRAVRAHLDQYRETHRNTGNADAFIGLSNILDSIEDLGLRMHTLHGYTTYDRKLSRSIRSEVDVEEFVVHQEIDRKMILDNLNFGSDIFRHSLRVSIATLAGYIISGFLPFGHGYWILLTIIVIMKPVYSLTKRRNFERLMGTLAGGFVGLLILYFIKDTTVLYVLMILFMIGTYVFIRTNYLVAVTLMTPYVLLVFHLLYPTDFRSILSDRVIDTIIGSAISFIASILIVPSWEHERITDFMTGALEANITYFKDVTGAFLGTPVSVHQYKLSRKNAFVALANLSDALSRMLSEPRRKQKSITEMHQFVVSNHMLTSHIATLAYYTPSLATRYADAAYRPVVDDIVYRLGRAIDILTDKITADAPPPAKDALIVLNEKARAAKEFKPIADQFNFISKVTTDIGKVTPPLHTALAAPQEEVGINPLV
ncbi:FUSC family protein [Puia dinghuensis]|uniref:Integral membrane protein YccS N-terminal domain-containing protein n=1 Tax=Puia dinghuensis TaxID=1792502 RepID=A0A8J2XU37_9BACT|nr:FUSC family membrane protein [Puia dinghuensis]GGB09067.1 hypothetical protein GCM10011511_35750 [Puia dinghuensis]